MQTEKDILHQIKSAIREVIPDAKVYLFGSRARGDWNEESDWDILVLTEKKYPKSIKWQIDDKLFPLSVLVGAIFQFILATEEKWKNAPELYALHKLANEELVAL